MFYVDLYPLLSFGLFYVDLCALRGLGPLVLLYGPVPVLANIRGRITETFSYSTQTNKKSSMKTAGYPTWLSGCCPETSGFFYADLYLLYVDLWLFYADPSGMRPLVSDTRVKLLWRSVLV